MVGTMTINKLQDGFEDSVVMAIGNKADPQW